MTTNGLALEVGNSKDSLEAIRSTLRHQVSEILRTQLKSLSSIPADRVYDHVLNTPDLLHECFQVFRSQPDLFRRVVMGRDKRPPTSDSDPLWCGRSVSEVVRLVVRASAKRHFREIHPTPPPEPAQRAEAPGLLGRAAIALKLKAAPPPPVMIRPQGHGDLLYSAFRSNLLYEWQVPLIPHYAPIELNTVLGLGSRILDFRDPAQLKVLAEEGLTAEGHLPLVLDTAKRLIGPEGGVSPIALSDVFVKLDLGTVFPSLIEAGPKRAISQIALMEPKLFKMIMAALDYDLKAMTMFLFSAYDRMGEKAFRQALGPSGAIWAIQKLSKHLEGVRPLPRSLPRLRQMTVDALGMVIDLGSGMPISGNRPAAISSGGPAKDASRATRTPQLAAAGGLR